MSQWILDERLNIEEYENIVLIMTLIVSCLFAGCDSLANKSEDKLSGDDFWAQGNETNAEAFC